MIGAFARVLSLREEAGSVRADDGVIARLRGARMLLIVDNCEHVAAAVAPLLSRVMADTATFVCW